MRDNIRHKLSDMLLPVVTQKTILQDIFGSQQGTEYTKGLLDLVGASKSEVQMG